jgi:hypothetical protein
MLIDDESMRRRRRFVLTSALAVAACVQAVIVFRSPIISRDGMTFIQIAQDLRTDPVTAMQAWHQHPGYPAAILAASKMLQRLGVEDSFTAELRGAQLVSNFAGLFCVAVVWHLAWRTYGERAAAVAALLAAALPVLRQNAADALSDSPHLLCYLAAAAAGTEGFRRLPQRGAAWWFAASGAASGAAFLIRPEGLDVAGVIGGLLLLSFVSRGLANRLTTASAALERENATSRLRMLAPLAALSLGVILVAGPYVAATGKLADKVINKPILTVHSLLPADRAEPSATPTSSRNETDLTHIESSEIVVNLPGYDEMFDERPRPRQAWMMLLTAIREFAKEFAQAHRYLLLLPLVIGLCFAGRACRMVSGAWLLIGLAVSHFALLIVLYCLAGYISHRHLIPIVATLLPITACGLVQICSFTASGFDPIRAHAGRLACSVVIIVLVLAPKTLRPLNYHLTVVTAAADWVRSQAQPGDELLTSSQYLSFYSRVPGQVLSPFFTPAAALSQPRRHPWPLIALLTDQQQSPGQATRLPGYAIAASFVDSNYPKMRVDVFRPVTAAAPGTDRLRR